MNDYRKMSADIPSWLNVEFFLKNLQNYYKNEKLKIQSFAVNPGTAKGVNYSSSIYRVTLQLLDGHTVNGMDIIVKTILTDKLGFDIISEFGVYDKEIEFYERIAPQIKIIYKQLEDSNQLLPETFGICKLNKAMLFENLTLKGYGLSSVKCGFDMVETKMALKKVATLHACCAVLQEHQPNIFDNFQHGKYSI